MSAVVDLISQISRSDRGQLVALWDDLYPRGEWTDAINDVAVKRFAELQYRERICQACNKPFSMNENGAGTKYCSSECKSKGYGRRVHLVGGDGNAGGFIKTIRCAWCDTESPARYNRGSIWPYICARCIEPIKHVAHRLKAHRVTHERARALIDDPGCEICGRDMIAKVLNPDTGKRQSWLHVDHDHSCCPAEKHSCGKCIRGLLCAHCNIALGMLKDDITSALRMVDYLRKWDRQDGLPSRRS